MLCLGWKRSLSELHFTAWSSFKRQLYNFTTLTLYFSGGRRGNRRRKMKENDIASFKPQNAGSFTWIVGSIGFFFISSLDHHHSRIASSFSSCFYFISVTVVLEERASKSFPKFMPTYRLMWNRWSIPQRAYNRQKIRARWKFKS